MLKSKILRYIIFTSGLFFMGLGVSLTTKSGLGTSPINSVPFVLSMIFHISMGKFTFLLSLLFFITEILILKKEFPKEQYMQLLVGPVFGLFIDLGTYIFSSVNPKIYPEKLVILIFGCIILAFGIYLQVSAKVIVNPGEGVVKAIADKTGKKFGTIKILFDSSQIITAAIISMIFFSTIKGIREGTILSAFLVGTMTKIYSAVFEHFQNKSSEHMDDICENCKSS